MYSVDGRITQLAIKRGSGKKDCDCISSCEEDFHEKESCRPSWERVFPKREGKCRFCAVSLPPDQETDGECDECEDLSTFVLVKKHAPPDGTIPSFN